MIIVEITFLIGNGFDVGVGMHSKFSDYFPIFCNDPKLSDEGRALAKAIEANEDDWSYFEKQMGVYAEKFTVNTRKSMINQIREFVQGFMKYLEKEEQSLDFSDRKQVSDVMIRGLMSFYSRDNLQIQSSDVIGRKFKNRSKEAHNYNFVCFNYTDVLENCLDTIENKTVTIRKEVDGAHKDTIGKVVYPHGKRNAFPIMGVNDTSQIKNSALSQMSRFIKYLVKPEINSAQRMNYDKTAEAILETSDIICIYGMSLGETDKLWWKKVIEWLRSDSTRQLVVFVFDKNYQTSTPYDLLEREDEVIDTFSQMYGYSSVIESLRSRIHVAIHKNIFSMELRKQSLIDKPNSSGNIDTRSIDFEGLEKFMTSYV